MNISQLRKKAKAMIAQGAADYKRRVGDPVDTAVMVDHKTGEPVETLSIRRRSVDREEFHRTYGEARDFLLKYGYEKSPDAKVQALYAELIPDSNELKSKKRSILTDLRSRDEAKRLAAAKECSRAARGVGEIGWDNWPKNPVVIETILKALKKEKSSNVAQELIIALGGMYERYYADARIPPVLLAYLDSNDLRLKRAALVWTRHMRDRAKWPKIIEILDSKPTTPILCSALYHLHSRTPVDVKRAVCSILLKTTTRKLGDEAKANLYGTILDMVDERTLADYKTALNKQKRLIKALAKRAEKRYGKGHARFKFLLTNLFAS